MLTICILTLWAITTPTTDSASPGKISDVSYRVFPLPVENPGRGNRVLIPNPWNPIASPNGWHNTGTLMTAGPNAVVGQDRDGDGSGLPIPAVSSTFDYLFDPTDPPSGYTGASLTQLFYMLNLGHDVFYGYGFNENAGNFQDDDPVIALLQSGADQGITNQRATVTVPPDGSSPVMTLYVHEYAFPNIVEVRSSLNNPFLGEAGGAEFGPDLDAAGITGRLVRVQDISGGTSQACDDLANAGAVAGNIAMIDRGDCTFLAKVRTAQQAGAIAVIIADNDPDGSPIQLTGSDPGITIPAVMIGYHDAESLLLAINTNPNLQVTLKSVDQNRRDSALDNGIIMRLYARAMAERLVGGPDTTFCLNHRESAIDGFADAIALAMTATSPNDATRTRGLGTWPRFQPGNGPGVLYAPYQSGQGEHFGDLDDGMDQGRIGAVFTRILRGLFWRLVTEYGYDPDLFQGQGGNNMALRLIIETMKNLGCHANLTQTRDTMLQIDHGWYDGRHQCLIWDAFAAYGLGVGAGAGDPNTLVDNIYDFSSPDQASLCLDEFYYEGAHLPSWTQPLAACTCERDENGRLDVSELIDWFNRTPVLVLDNDTVVENSPAGTPIGSFSVTTPAGDSLPAVFFMIAQDVPGAFSLGDDVLTVQTASLIDHELHQEIAITVEAVTGNFDLRQTFFIRIQNVHEAPELITPVPNLTNLVQDTAFTPLDVRSYFLDPDSDELTYTWSGLPGGTGFTTSPTGILGGRPNNTDAILDSINITVTASDGSLSTSDQFQVTVANINDPPQVGSIPDATATEDTTITIDAGSTFTDVDHDPLAFSLTGPASGSGITIDQNSGILHMIINDADVWDAYNRDNGMTIPLSVTATDGEYSVARTFLLTVINVNDAPLFNGPAPIFDQDQGQPILVDFSTYFSDPDPGTTLTYSIENLPTGTGLSMNPTTGIFSGIPNQADADAGPIFLVLKASDGETTTSELIQFSINDINLPPQTVGSIPDINADQGDTINLDLNPYFTNPDGDALMFEILGVTPETGLSITNDYLTGYFSQADTGQRALAIRVQDNNALSIAHPLLTSIADLNLAPETVGSISSIHADQGDVINLDLNPYFTDPDGDTLVFQLIGAATGTGRSIVDNHLIGSFTQTDTGHQTLSIKAQDNNALAATQSLATFIADINLPPVCNCPIPEIHGLKDDPSFSFDLGSYFSDPDGDPLIFSIGPIPFNLFFDSQTGVLYGTPSYPGSHNFIIDVYDGQTSLSESLFIRIDSSYTTPLALISPIPDQTYPVGDPYVSYPISQHFTDPDDNGTNLTFSATGLLPEWGLEISSTGTLRGVPQITGSAIVTVVAQDSDGFTASDSFILDIFEGFVATLSVTPTNGGTLSHSNSSHYLIPGSDFFVEVLPASGYRFLHWMINGQNEPCGITICSQLLMINIQEDKAIVAEFERIP